MTIIMLAVLGFVGIVTGIRREIKHPCVQYEDLIVTEPPRFIPASISVARGFASINQPYTSATSVRRVCVERKNKKGK